MDRFAFINHTNFLQSHLFIFKCIYYTLHIIFFYNYTVCIAINTIQHSFMLIDADWLQISVEIYIVLNTIVDYLLGTS